MSNIKFIYPFERSNKLWKEGSKKKGTTLMLKKVSRKYLKLPLIWSKLFA